MPSVLPASRRQIVRPRIVSFCRQDVGSTLNRYPHLLRSPLDRRHPAAVEPSFPLTLTLSLREREQQTPGVCSAHTGLANSVAGIAERRRTILLWVRGRP